mmetsp:Transcript_2585/g.6605  ORF Transcript_2585/g.6605 Transcript_2585/m.6605 type:complete len:202 (+) Transcript_2585:352-957(+)
MAAAAAACVGTCLRRGGRCSLATNVACTLAGLLSQNFSTFGEVVGTLAVILRPLSIVFWLHFHVGCRLRRRRLHGIAWLCRHVRCSRCSKRPGNRTALFTAFLHNDLCRLWPHSRSSFTFLVVLAGTTNSSNVKIVGLESLRFAAFAPLTILVLPSLLSSRLGRLRSAASGQRGREVFKGLPCRLSVCIVESCNRLAESLL